MITTWYIIRFVHFIKDNPLAFCLQPYLSLAYPSPQHTIRHTILPYFQGLLCHLHTLFLILFCVFLRSVYKIIVLRSGI